VLVVLEKINVNNQSFRRIKVVIFVYRSTLMYFLKVFRDV